MLYFRFPLNEANNSMLAIFLDQETSGLDPARHHVLDIAFKVYDLQTGEMVLAYQNVVELSEEEWEARDRVSIEVNGFTWDRVSQGKPKEEIEKEIIELFTKLGIERNRAVFICQNPAFDRSFFSQIVNVYVHEKLKWPYHWLDLASMYWMKTVQQSRNEKVPFPERLNLSKDEIASQHNLPPEAKPHAAMNGVDHLVLCYDAVVGIPTRISV